jgi:hypothetical protein
MILQMSFRRLVLIGFLMVSVSLSFLALGLAGPVQATASNPVLAQQDDDDDDDDDDNNNNNNGTAPVGGVQTGGGGTSIVLAQEDDDDDDDGDDDNGAPVGGVQTGGGGAASSGMNTLPFALGGGALVAAVGGFLIKRRLAQG